MEQTEKTIEKEEVKEAIEILPLEEAAKIAAEMRAANAERLKLIEREEKLAAIRMLGGKSVGGQTAPQKSEAEVKKEMAKEFWKGTDIARAIERHG